MLYPVVDEDSKNCEELRENHGFLFENSRRMWLLIELLETRHNQGECLHPDIYREIVELKKKKEELEKSRL